MTDMTKKLLRPARGTAALGIVSVLAGCGNQIDHEPITEPLHINKRDTSAQTIEMSPNSIRSDHLTATAGPTPPLGQTSTGPLLASMPPKLAGDPVSVKFEGIRLAAFINTVFGDIFKVAYEIDSSLMQKDVMVTLSTGDTPLPRDAFYHMVEEVLTNYGVGIVYANNVYRIVEATSVKKPIPRIIRSRAMSSVPNDLRPVFFFQQINSVPVTTMTVWLEMILKDRVQAVSLPYANGLLLLGNPDDVAAANEIIQTLDQPYLAGSQSLRISPAFWSAQKLAQQLNDIMTAEGYSISMGAVSNAAIKLVPVEASNMIIAFSTNQEGLQHLLQWATQLDQPSQTVSSQGAYYTQVRNAKAKDLADTIKSLVETTTQTTNADQKTNTTSTKTKITVDAARNGLIFVGTAEEYAQFLSLVRQMDRAPLQVMIEATIAEVTLQQGESLDMLFNYAKGGADAINQTSVKSDGTGLFFSLVRDHGDIMSQINAMANYNRVQILSAPRLVTSSGKPAAINVGTQVPIITSQESTPGLATVAGTSSILQSVQYRDTGIILNIQPTINSNKRVELDVSEQVSDAQANNLSGVESPLILQRSLQTTLSLDDGQTALLGGMISENYSKSYTGIPYLEDIPILGNLFKNQSKSIDRTELIVLLTPYIIDSSDTSDQIRDAFREKLGDWAAPTPATAAPGAKTDAATAPVKPAKTD